MRAVCVLEWEGGQGPEGTIELGLLCGRQEHLKSLSLGFELSQGGEVPGKATV